MELKARIDVSNYPLIIVNTRPIEQNKGIPWNVFDVLEWSPGDKEISFAHINAFEEIEYCDELKWADIRINLRRKLLSMDFDSPEIGMEVLKSFLEKYGVKE